MATATPAMAEVHPLLRAQHRHRRGSRFAQRTVLPRELPCRCVHRAWGRGLADAFGLGQAAPACVAGGAGTTREGWTSLRADLAWFLSRLPARDSAFQAG